MTTTTRNIIEELKRAATEQGAGEAVRTIAGPALETWMRALDGKDAGDVVFRRRVPPAELRGRLPADQPVGADDRFGAFAAVMVHHQQVVGDRVELVAVAATRRGGGIGMRVCRSAAELSDAFEAVKRLGQNNFSDSGVFLTLGGSF